MMVLLIDHYDSFSYNVYQLVGSIREDVRVIRSDELTVDAIWALAPSHIILSPGPGHPKDAGVYEDLLRSYTGQCPILGICLGHQAIGDVFGGRVTYAKEIMHGKPSDISIEGKSPILDGLEAPITVARYHSLVIDSEHIGDELLVTARTADGEIMAVQHKTYPLYGLQFHPESILTPRGRRMMENFLALC